MENNLKDIEIFENKVSKLNEKLKNNIFGKNLAITKFGLAILSGAITLTASLLAARFSLKNNNIIDIILISCVLIVIIYFLINYFRRKIIKFKIKRIQNKINKLKIKA